MRKLTFYLLAWCPALLFAQADTVRVSRCDGNLLSEETKYDYQPAPLYEYNWVAMSGLPSNAWQTRHNRALLFPANSKAVALRFFVKNDSPKAQELVLEIDDMQMDRAKIWVEKPGGQVDSSRMSGDKMPFHHRDIAFANPNFKINLAAGETAAVLAYLDQSGLFLMPRLRLWPVADFAEYASRRQLIAGLILGFFGISLLVFSFAALFQILPVAKWYAGFIGVQTLQIATQLGIGHQFLWPQSGVWSTLLALVLPLAGFVLLFKLLTVFLDLNTRLPTWYRVLRNGVLVLVGYTALAYLIYLSGAHRPLLVLYPLGMFLAIGLCACLVVSCLRVWQKYREINSLLFLLAFSFSIAGAVVSWLVKMGLSLGFDAGRHGIVVGFVFDMLTFNYLISRDLWQTKTRSQALRLALAEASQEAASSLLRGQEDERKRLSMALHDGVGIELGSIRRRLEKTFAYLNGPENTEAQQTVSDLGNVAEQIRKFSHALDPFSIKNLSLPDLLDNLLFDFENNCPGVSVHFSKHEYQVLEKQHLASLSENEKHLFFIAAELLNNIARHARASNVRLKLERFPEKMVLEVVDNGIGYDPANTLPGVGLSHIRSRVQLSGAAFDIRRLPENGMFHRIAMPVGSAPKTIAQTF